MTLLLIGGESVYLHLQTVGVNQFANELECVYAECFVYGGQGLQRCKL
jgi:hypothetical protein